MDFNTIELRNVRNAGKCTYPSVIKSGQDVNHSKNKVRILNEKKFK